MKLAASLLALVAAAPALVFAAPSSDCTSATPSPDGGGDHREIWLKALADGLKDHMNLAELTVNFIANNFENPPFSESGEMRTSAILTIPDPGEIIVDGDAHFDIARPGDLLAPEEFTVRSGVLKFKRKNFNIGPNGRRVHVLSEGTPSRAEKLWKFYSAIWTFLNPREAARRSPPVPDILRSVDGDRLNLQAEFTNDAVRDFLASVANELPRAVHENLGAQYSPDDVAGWVNRLSSLDLAISNVHLYDNDPLIYHRAALEELQDLLKEEKSGWDPIFKEYFRLTQVIVTSAANAVKRACS
ncbi:MAG: hypothetical protein BJ554DRAFT_4034 [Olpidium bornovanus]|uniref:Uncharacterized protein n=1 Tax=Olpidium bornovanus TaxID=278681 RepID=A0A8H7ZND3_9FUNG|nr:MAG: hypothetical protein BJ554DRAFT_4034 [Olpidium bornovanus]